MSSVTREANQTENMNNRKGCSGWGLTLRRGETYKLFLGVSQDDSSPPTLSCVFWWHCFLCLASSLAFVYTFSVSSEPNKYLVYLTSWGLGLSMVTYQLQVLATLLRFFAGRRHVATASPTPSQPQLRPLEQALWFCLYANASLCFVITGFYWLSIFPQLRPQVRSIHLLDKLLGHGLTPCLVLTDFLFFAKRPHRWQHFYPGLLFGLGWVCFSLVYYLAGGRGYVRHSARPETGEGNAYIYKSVHWADWPKALAYVAGVGLLLVLVHMAFVAGHKLMEKLKVVVLERRRRHDQAGESGRGDYKEVELESGV